ncbi:MAG TPA: methionine ABC transporter permease [Clostridia bacterium]|nr:methionine ABC transporter permease [Clostridia bacterium]
MGYFSNVSALKKDILQETIATLYMTSFSALIAGFIGLILGIVLVVTQRQALLENRLLYTVTDKLINLLRAIPFIILMALIAPVTRWIVGTRIGNKAAIVPLVFSAAPFFAKQVEQALSSLDYGLIEAAISMGDGPMDIIFSVYLKEGFNNLVRASAITLISLLGLTTMAGAIGAGGIGKLAIAVGYNTYKDDIVLVSVVIILILVYSIQGLANLLIKKNTH